MQKEIYMHASSHSQQYSSSLDSRCMLHNSRHKKEKEKEKAIDQKT